MEWLDGLHALIGREGEDITWWRMAVRAVIVFLFGVALVRVAGKRVFGKWGAIDIILSIVIGSNLSRAMTGNAPFVQTLAATAVLVALHLALIALAARVPALGPLLKGRAAQVVGDGRPDPNALKQHGMGEHDLEAALRGAGVGDVSEVRELWIERNGDVSVLKR